MKFKFQKKLIVHPSIIVLLLVSPYALATQCGILHVQKSRTSGSTITDNECASPSDLGLKSVIELSAGAKLWLESSASTLNTDQSLIMCQNKTTAPIKIKVQTPVFPWITASDSSHCSDWTENRLTCHQADKTSIALLCAIAKKPTPVVSGTIADRTTSYTMRSINIQSPAKAVQELATLVKPGIEICRKIMNTKQPITLSWSINVSGDAVNAISKSPKTDSQFTDCAIEALENIHFPTANQQLTATF